MVVARVTVTVTAGGLMLRMYVRTCHADRKPPHDSEGRHVPFPQGGYLRASFCLLPAVS